MQQSSSPRWLPFSLVRGVLALGLATLFQNFILTKPAPHFPNWLYSADKSQTRPGGNVDLRFVDVAKTAGITFLHVSGRPEKKTLLESVSGGVAWIDYNLDGWPDLYLVNAGRWEDLATGKRTVGNALYRNNQNGTFANVSEQAGVENSHWGLGVAVGDYDNDRRPDLYVCNYGANTLYRNLGDGTFRDVTASSGVGDPRLSSSAAFADYDEDGWLDLYVTNYVQFDPRTAPWPCPFRNLEVLCGPKGLIPEPDVLYRNNGDGTFSNMTGKTGMAVAPAYGLGAVWGDYDNDGDSDLFVANDSMANYLFRNDGAGRFEETGLLSGIAFNEDGRAQAGMGLDLGDYDRDGFFDLYVTNFSEDYNSLYRNLGNGRFRDVTYLAGVGFPSWKLLGWGAVFADFDNNGWEDLFVSNGHIYPQVDDSQLGTRFEQSKLLFQNMSNGKFREIAQRSDSGLNQPFRGRGAAFADFDNDGDVDVVVNNIDGLPSLFRNEVGNRNGHWLVLTLEGVQKNRSAIGTRVMIDNGGGRQIREVRGGSSYQATNDLRLHFGLGEFDKVERLTVRWGPNQVQTFQNLAADRRYHLIEGGTIDVAEPQASYGSVDR